MTGHRCGQKLQAQRQHQLGHPRPGRDGQHRTGNHQRPTQGRRFGCGVHAHEQVLGTQLSHPGDQGEYRSGEYQK
jgi:hypothetical protein